MLDKRRIRLMSRMAAYEKKYAEEDLKISTYYKKDYASLNTLISILWVSVGYIIVAALVVLCNLDAILKKLTVTKLVTMGGIAVGVYLILIIVCSVCAGSFYKSKYSKAKQRVKRYYRDLSRLGKMEVKEKR